MTEADIEALADRVFAAIEAGDVVAISAVWADDIVVWHNTDQIEQGKAANLAVLGWIADKTMSRQYRDIRRVVHHGGFVQQHVLHLQLADGREFDLPAALFVRVADHQVTRIDEYMDGVAVAALVARTS